MELLVEFFRRIGSLICHQLPSRTIYIENVPLPMCSRDTGIYAGVFFALMYIVLRRRLSADKPPGIKPALMLCVFMLPMMYDGITSYMGLRDTNNAARLFTGVLFGVPIPFFLVPTANFNVYRKNTKEILKSWKEVALVTFSAVVFCILILKTNFIPWLFVSVILTVSFVFLIGRIVFTIFARAALTGKRYFNMIFLGALAVVFLSMYLISNFVLHPLIGM